MCVPRAAEKRLGAGEQLGSGASHRLPSRQRVWNTRNYSNMSEDIDKRVTKNYDVQQKCAIQYVHTPDRTARWRRGIPARKVRPDDRNSPARAPYLPGRLGKGAYGIVWKAVDKRKDKAAVAEKVVAVKKIFDAFQNSTDAQRTYREIVFLQQFRGHENIVRLEEVIKADNDRDIYLVFEYMETDLHATIRANILEEIHKQYIMYQAFKALKYMHSAGLVHRDMKPANLLLNAECLMKVADFGLARSLTGGGDGGGGSVEDKLTDYIATRWYRAPEILVGSERYGYEVDLWSLGCIFAEMLSAKPCFSGTSTLNQIERIIETLGFPTEVEITSMESQFTVSLISNVHVSNVHVSEKEDDQQQQGAAAEEERKKSEVDGAPSRPPPEGAAAADATANRPTISPEEQKERWRERFCTHCDDEVCRPRLALRRRRGGRSPPFRRRDARCITLLPLSRPRLAPSPLLRRCETT